MPKKTVELILERAKEDWSNVLKREEEKIYLRSKAKVKDNNSFYRLVKAGKKVHPKTISERMYLYCFKLKKKMRRGPVNRRINILRIAARIQFNTKIPYAKRRSKKHKTRFGTWCHVCWGERAYYYHHMIQIKNGGKDNGINRIPICEKCHELIHEHLMIARLNENMDQLYREAVDREP